MPTAMAIPAEPPFLVTTKMVDYVANPKATHLFTIRRDSSGLLFVCWLIIFGLETYYRNVTKTDEAIYVGGVWSILGLFVMFRRNYLLKELGNRWRNANNGIDRQTIHIRPEGLEVEHCIGTQIFGTRLYLPWSTLNRFDVTKSSFCFIQEWHSTIWISREYFTEAEAETIKYLVNSHVKKQESLPTFKRLLGR